MIGRALAKVERLRHRRSLRRILRTPPVQPGDGRVVIFSQVCARDVLMYLVAAKSFAQHTGIGDFAILDDGSLRPRHRELLRRHLPSLQITPVEDARSEALPVGGTWERLLTIARLGERAYVVQLDADTLTLGPLALMTASVAAGRAFSLTSEPQSAVLPIAEAVANARRHPQHLLQFAVEAQLEAVCPELATHYVRGCSGFTGLPPGSRVALVEEISRRMGAVMGERWSEWGTEQVTTNLLTANAPGVTLLKPPVYATHEGRGLPNEARFVHFMGTHRFSGSLYRRLTERAIDALRQDAADAPGSRGLPDASPVATV